MSKSKGKSTSDTSGSAAPNFRFETEVLIAARRETVFGFFTDPVRFGQWMGAAYGVAAIDPRVGGLVSVDFAAAGKKVQGQVLELSPPHRFVFTWGFADGAPFPAGSTQVEITLEEKPDGTLLRLRHSGLPSEIAARDHGGGWRIYTSVLAARAAEHALFVPARAAVDAWFAAWNESDAARRAEQIALCLASDGEFRHPYAAVSGREALSGHIATSQAVMRGIRLVADGEPELCHFALRFGWKAVAGEQTVSTGANFGILDLDGRFKLVAGFTDQKQT